ncbi:hypothetical protein [Leptospira brenneri]|uniref:Uncharacterized protein n=1 Tax=Leptospira brenneri TaxID=2023182 RepID=A0A2M9XXL1_9LEPT|nr:hypothetical protein [Leptospira brenneri]PJZ43903.1 hypothetical protein CH361_18030 [Leptospira brenneri]TGK93012.1 hypothetical protein EHQ30_12350 [Leptospira brenneri]
MTFQFPNLDSKTREYMKNEFDLDVSISKLYNSKRLNDLGRKMYSELLKEAIDNKTPEWLASEIIRLNLLKTHEERKTKTGTTMAKIPSNAHEMLAEGEFNRFYIRALCKIAIEEKKIIKVVRGKQVSVPREESNQKLGSKCEPSLLLNDLRENIGVDTALGLPPGPNSGLTVAIE